MKPKVIFLLVLLAVAIGYVMSTYMEASKTSTFTEAQSNPDEIFHISGFLMKDMPFEYDPIKDPNYFTFYIKDKDGKVCKVISSEPKQPDFERAETVNMYGKAEGEVFRATKVMPKCPSKYKDEEINKAVKEAQNAEA